MIPAKNLHFSSAPPTVVSCDPLRADSGSSNEQNLLRLCDMHSVPIATNIATAEVLLRGMDQGDLDYREGMHPPVIEPLAAPRRAVC